MGNLLFKLGYSFIKSLIVLCTPSYIIAYIKSSCPLSKIILNINKLVDSWFDNFPFLNIATSFLIRKCLLAYIINSVKTPGALSFWIKVVFMIEMLSSLIGKVFLKARNSRSILENYMLNSLKSWMYSANIFSMKLDLTN